MFKTYVLVDDTQLLLGKILKIQHAEKQAAHPIKNELSTDEKSLKGKMNVCCEAVPPDIIKLYNTNLML